jgi:hypothetical protein
MEIKLDYNYFKIDSDGFTVEQQQQQNNSTKDSGVLTESYFTKLQTGEGIIESEHFIISETEHYDNKELDNLPLCESKNIQIYYCINCNNPCYIFQKRYICLTCIINNNSQIEYLCESCETNHNKTHPLIVLKSSEADNEFQSLITTNKLLINIANSNNNNNNDIEHE